MSVTPDSARNSSSPRPSALEPSKPEYAGFVVPLVEDAVEVAERQVGVEVLPRRAHDAVARP